MPGGLCPFPLRLGPAFVSPSEWLRLGADISTASTPLAILLIQEIAGGTCSVSGLSRGNSMMTDLPAEITATWSAPAGPDNYVDITFPFGYNELETGAARSWRPMGVTSQVAANYLVVSGADLVDLSDDHYTIRVQYLESSRLGPLLHVVVVHGLTEPRFAGDYGATADKRISASEGERPYSWQWLLEMRQVRGDAFSIAPGSFTEMENIALARHFGMIQRCAERHASSQAPEKSDQALGRWAKILNIGGNNNRDWELRDAAAAKFAITIAGPTVAGLTSAAETIFRHNFVQIVRNNGSLASDSEPTYWPAGDVGPGALDIGGGVWTTHRYHYTIQLTAGTDTERIRLLGVAKNTFDDLLLSALPPICTWSYTFSSPGTGPTDPHESFILGTSELGRNGI